MLRHVWPKVIKQIYIVSNTWHQDFTTRTAITAPPTCSRVHTEVTLEPSVPTISWRLKLRVETLNYLSTEKGNLALAYKFHGLTAGQVDRNFKWI